MASLGDYKVDVDNTTNQGDFSLMPEMYAKLEVSSGEVLDTKDEKGKQAALIIDVLEPAEYAGRKLWVYWTIRHSDPSNGGFKFGKVQFDRLCRAVGVSDPQDTDDLLFKSFTAKIGISIGKPNPAGGSYKDKNEIKHFYYPDPDAPEPTPEPGVITTPEGKAEPTRAPANDNRAPTQNAANSNAAPAGAPKKTPWGKKAA